MHSRKGNQLPPLQNKASEDEGVRKESSERICRCQQGLVLPSLMHLASWRPSKSQPFSRCSSVASFIKRFILYPCPCSLLPSRLFTALFLLVLGVLLFRFLGLTQFVVPPSPSPSPSPCHATPRRGACEKSKHKWKTNSSSSAGGTQRTV